MKKSRFDPPISLSPELPQAELEVINFPKALNNGIETVGNVIFWIVVGFFGFWIICKFVSNIKTLREEG